MKHIWFSSDCLGVRAPGSLHKPMFWSKIPSLIVSKTAPEQGQVNPKTTQHSPGAASGWAWDGPRRPQGRPGRSQDVPGRPKSTPGQRRTAPRAKTARRPGDGTAAQDGFRTAPRPFPFKTVQDRPTTTPRSPPNGPSRRQDKPKRLPNSPKTAPRYAHDGPGPPQGRLRSAQDTFKTLAGFQTSLSKRSAHSSFVSANLRNNGTFGELRMQVLKTHIDGKMCRQMKAELFSTCTTTRHI